MHNAVIFEKNNNFYFCKIKTFIIKNIKEKFKHKSKKIKSKIIYDLLVCRFITFYIYKFKKIVNYYQNIVPVNYFIKKLNKFNLVFFNYNLKSKTQYKLQININLS